MYVYLISENGLVFTVGHYDPRTNEWRPESDHGNLDSAAARAIELNGGIAVKQVPRGQDEPVGLRDYFAGQALGRMMAAIITNGAKKSEEDMATAFAEVSYKVADAMMLARKAVAPDAE